MNEKNKFHYCWVVLISACFALGVSNAAAISMISIFLVPITKALNISVTAYLVNVTFITLGAIIVSPIAGKLAETKGSRFAVILGGSIITVGFVILSFATSLIILYTGYILLAIGVSLSTTVIATSLSVHWFIKARGLATGILVAGGGFAGLVLAPIVAKVIINNGYQTAYLVLAAISFVFIVVNGGLLIRNHPEDKGLKPFGYDANADTSDNKNANVTGMPLSRALKTITFWFIIIGLSLYASALFAQAQTHNAFIQSLGFAPMLAAGIVSIYSLFNGFGKIIFGFLTDKLPVKIVTIIAVACSVASSILLYTFTAKTSVTLLYTYAILIGLGVGSFAPILAKHLSENFGAKYFPTIFGISFTIFNLTCTVTPYISSAFKDLKGTYVPSYLIFAIIAACGAVIVMLYKKVNFNAPENNVNEK